MINIKKLKYPFSCLKTNKSEWLPGAVFFTLLFLVSTVMNFSLTYMGNTSEKAVSMVLQHYLFVIIFQILKVLFLYVIIGSLLSIVFSRAFKEIQKRSSFIKKHESFYIVLFTVIALFLFTFLLFSEKLIQNPQSYVENFSAHSIIFKHYQYLLTDNFSPMLFKIIRYIILIAFAVFFTASFNFKKILLYISEALRWLKSLSFRYKAILLTAFALFFVFKFSYYFIYNNTDTGKPNILILSSDALRPDHFSCNGYERNTTPNLDRFVKESFQVRGMFTVLPRTFPSWVSILTSKYPLSHGIKHMFPRTRERIVKFESAVSYLNNEGYRTSVISDFAGDIFPRIDLGFDKVSAPDMNTLVLIRQIILEKQTFLLPFISNKFGLGFFPEMKDMAKLTFPEYLTEETIAEIESSGKDPFFIVTFYSITHFPFSPPYPYYKKYTDPDYQGGFKYFKDRVVNLNQDRTVSAEVRDEDKKQVVALYDGCVSKFDREAGKVIEFLRDSKKLDNTIVLILSDHGENLYDCDFGMGHGEHLKGNDALEIPFIVHHPALDNLKGQTVRLTSSSIDVMPTLFDIAQFSKPDYFTGKSMLNRINSSESCVSDNFDAVNAYSETGMWFDNDKSSPLFFHHQRIDYPDISGVSGIDFNYNDEVVTYQEYQNIVNAAKYRAIFSGQYKLIYIPLKDRVKFELYNFKEDPDNCNDLSKSRKDVLDKMKILFYDFIDKESAGNFIFSKDYIFPAFNDPVY
ncbi:MAG: sulfatase-like hydrolase/transferase [Spirochaetes bacterium]|nr:sulfatase-like hydrolase/transferase [Spirochaetota bacterium]